MESQCHSATLGSNRAKSPPRAHSMQDWSASLFASFQKSNGVTGPQFSGMRAKCQTASGLVLSTRYPNRLRNGSADIPATGFAPPAGTTSPSWGRPNLLAHIEKIAAAQVVVTLRLARPIEFHAQGEVDELLCRSVQRPTKRTKGRTPKSTLDSCSPATNHGLQAAYASKKSKRTMGSVCHTPWRTIEGVNGFANAGCK